MKNQYIALPLWLFVAYHPCCPVYAEPSVPIQDSVELEAITVTARKRTEALQKVPFSIFAMQSDGTDSGGGNDEMGDLARQSANLTLTEPGGTYSNAFLIRGVGSLQAMAADDSAVAVYENGVPKSITSAPITLFDARRVEVMRGPQGTLFGRNSQGGAIAVIHNAPEFNDSLHIGSGFGNLQQKNIALIANKRWSDNIASRLAIRHSAHDGYIKNVATGDDNGKQSLTNIRASLSGFIGDSNEVNLSAWLNRKTSDNPRLIWLNNPDFPQVAINPNNNVGWRDIGASAKFMHESDTMRFSSLSSFENSHATQDMDFTDGLVFSAMMPKVPAPVFNQAYADYSDMNHKERRWQQEFHLSSNQQSDWQWQIGTNLFYSQFENDTTSQAKLRRYAWLNGKQNNHIDTLSSAIFGELDIPLGDIVRANVGARITHERKKANYSFYGNGHKAVVKNFSYQDKMTNTLFSGRAGLSAQVNPQNMLYANLARGSTSGGFPLFSMTLANGKKVASYPKSSSLSYEAGNKWHSKDNRAQVNAGVFYNTVKDGHIIVFNRKEGQLNTVVQNYYSYGAELEGSWNISPAWSLNANIAYTHARLHQVAVNDKSGAKNGNRLANVPAISGAIGAHYQSAQGVFADLNWQYVGKRTADLQNSFDLGAYSLLNAKIGYGKDRWQVYVYGRNLGNKQAQIAGQSWSPTVQSVRLGAPRLFGIGFKANW